jgi:hypothetical protein
VSWLSERCTRQRDLFINVPVYSEDESGKWARNGESLFWQKTAGDMHIAWRDGLQWRLDPMAATWGVILVRDGWQDGFIGAAY